jgi:hypothetical protein
MVLPNVRQQPAGRSERRRGRIKPRECPEGRFGREVAGGNDDRDLHGHRDHAGRTWPVVRGWSTDACPQVIGTTLEGFSHREEAWFGRRVALGEVGRVGKVFAHQEPRRLPMGQ